MKSTHAHLITLIILILFGWSAACSSPAPVHTLEAEIILPLATKDEASKIDPVKTPRSKSYLALGDSYTIGTSVKQNESFPAQLVDQLKQEGISIGAPTYVARNGWTTGEIADGIQKAGILPGYDLVTLLIGVNNQFRGYSEDGYAVEFSGLLQQAIAFAGGDASKVIVVSIPDWGAMPFAAGKDRETISTQINQFNAINRAITGTIGAAYVNITEISREVGDDPEMVALDELHPSGAQYALWVEAILPIALATLSP